MYDKPSVNQKNSLHHVLSQHFFIFDLGSLKDERKIEGEGEIRKSAETPSRESGGSMWLQRQGTELSLETRKTAF